MKRIATALAFALGLPAAAAAPGAPVPPPPGPPAQHDYQYQDEHGQMYSDEPGEPGQGAYSEYNPSEAVPPNQGQGAEPAAVDVNVETPGAAVSFDTFHDALSPYGEWVTVG